MKPAWLMERELRDSAVPLDRRTHASDWYESGFSAPCGDDLLNLFWSSNVPGSGAPEIPYQEMVQAQSNKGFDVSAAESLIPRGIELHAQGKTAELRALTARLLSALNNAQSDSANTIHQYDHPREWADALAAMEDIQHGSLLEDASRLDEQILQAWVGQLAGGSFGTAIEGYTGAQIARVYGEISNYIVPPETTNDDVVYELVFLDVFERLGRKISALDLGLEWVKQIPFGWSAEWVALRNLNNGILPPESGSFQNPYSHWIGAQMRGMVCGMLAPGWPLEAARLAWEDGVVSHDTNGVYGEIYAAVLTALAFVRDDPRAILQEAANYLPRRSEYAAVVRGCLRTVEEHANPADAWEVLEKRFERYNCIHAYPNIAAVITSLWYGGGDMTASFSLLAKAGLDVDCNAGLAGTVLGVMRPVPPTWAEPLGDLLETYIQGKERLSIRELAARTARLARLEN